MSTEDRNEDRLTKNEFAELIQHLSVQEILTIEFRVGTDWNKLFSRKNLAAHMFVCNLCVLEVSSFKTLLSHIDGKKHKTQMERVQQLYHPDYTHPKDDKNEISKKPTKGVLNSNSELNSLGNGNKEKSEKNGDKEKSEKNVLQNHTNILTAKPAKPCVSLKSINDTGTSNVSSSQNKINDLTKTSKNTEKLGVNNKEQNEAVNAPSVVKSTTTRNTEEIKNLQTSPKQKANEIKTKNVSQVKLLNSGTSLIVTKSTSVTSQKRSLSDNSSDLKVDAKKPNVVINPAAALLQKSNSTKVNEVKENDDKEKPQYQTDKIIIPTAHKSKSPSRKTSPTSKNHDQPKFSVKSYSVKPSDNDVYGLLGVEYVIKIMKNRHDLSPRYECGLCEFVLAGYAMQRHLEGYNHRLKFCEKHFPTAMRHYRQYMQNVPESELYKVMTPVLAKLAIAIEQHHGRNLPYECYERDFNLNRHEILAKAFSCRHASEQYGPTFTHVVGSKEIDELINNKQNFSPIPPSRSAIFDMKPGCSNSDSRHQSSKTANKEYSSRDRHRHAARENTNVEARSKSYMSSGFNEVMHPSTVYQQTVNTNVQRVDDATYNLMVDDFLKDTLKGLPGNNRVRDYRKRSLSPSQNLSSSKRKSLSPLRQDDIWQAYRHMVDQELGKLDEHFKQYRNDPETHPSYNEEWQKFWKRRKDELVSAGLDHRQYNYQPEWVRFIKIRIEELYGQEVENLKIKSRERLCLPLTNDHITDVKYHVKASNLSSSNETTSPLSSTATSDNPQVVSVLRLMTALEDSLGSLGPKIIDLLSKALQIEKTNPLQVNAIILNDDNCSLIETAKEKIKGLIIVGLSEGPKKRAFKQVVNDAEKLLQYAYQNRQTLLSQRSSFDSSLNRTQNNPSFSLGDVTDPLARKSLLTKSSSLTNKNLLTQMDKKELASKLAASLVAQGKKDFDPQQLQQLIAVYKLIEKKKRDNTGTDQPKKDNVDSLPTSKSSNKKALSDTLSDLLKTTPSTSNASQSKAGVSTPSVDSRQFPSNVSNTFQQNQFRNSTSFGNNVPSYPFTGVLQNSSDNYLQNTAQSMSNTYGVSSGGGSQLQQSSAYPANYANNMQLPNPNMSHMYNNQYQNNRMTQQWSWNSNNEMNQNYNMGGPNNNQTSNWQNF